MKKALFSRPRMFPGTTASSALAVAITLHFIPSPAFAIDVTKASNNNALNLGSSWVDDGTLGDIVPGSGDVAVWNSTAFSTFAALGADSSWGGIRIVNPNGLANILAGNTLTLGTSGIDMSAATQNLFIDANMVFGSNQSLNVARSRTLLFRGSVTFAAGTTTTVSGVGGVQFSCPTGTVLTGAGNLVVDSGVVFASTQGGTSDRTGSTILNGGIISITTTTDLFGTGTLILNGGTISSGDSTSRVVPNPVTIGGNVTLGVPSSGAMIFSGAANLNNGTRTLALNVNTAFSGSLSDGPGAGAGSLVKLGENTVLTLSGANSFAGSTTVNGTLALDYSAQNNSKLSNSAGLVLNNAVLQLAGDTGNHTEVVGSVTINGATSITRNGLNTAVIALGNYTNNGLLNVTAAGLATTTKNNNASGYLDNTTFGGTQLAANDGTGKIVVAATVPYDNVTRTESGSKVITNRSVAGAVTRIVDGVGTTPANITVATGTTDIDTLFQTATGGATTVDLTGGTLRLGATGQVISGGSALTIQKGILTAGGAVDTPGQLALLNSGANALTITSAITNNGTGAVSLRTAGNVTLGSTSFDSLNSYTGGTTVTGGRLTIAAGSTGLKTVLGTGAVSVNNGGTLYFLNTGISNPLSYANDINLTDSTLASENGVISFDGTISLAGASVVNVVNTSAVFNKGFTGSGNLTKTGSTLIIAGDNGSYGGSYTISSGPLQIGNNGTTGTLGSGPVINKGTLVFDRTDSFAFNNNISGTGDISQLGTGTTLLGGINTFLGATTVQNGVLSVANLANALGSTSGITLGINKTTTGTLTYTGAGETFAKPFTLNGNGNIVNNSAGTLVLSGGISGNDNLLNYSLNLQGSGTDGRITGNIGVSTTTTVNKIGTGTWRLLASNSYLGDTYVNEGTLVVNGGIHKTTVANGATIGGSGNLGPLTVNSGGFVSPGDSLGILSTGTFTLVGTLKADIKGATPGSLYDQVNVTGSINLTGGELSLSLGSFVPGNGNLFFLVLNDGSDAVTGTFNGLPTDGSTFTLGGQQWQISYQADSATNAFTGGNDVALMAVPEPGALASLLGVFGVAFGLRRRRV